MKYMLLLAGGTDQTEAEAAEEMPAWFAYDQAVKDAGVFVAGDALFPVETAKTVAVATGTVTDGPFAETKEVIGGYYVLDVEDEAAAIDWAKKLPPSTTAEVRQVMVFDEEG